MIKYLPALLLVTIMTSAPSWGASPEQVAPVNFTRAEPLIAALERYRETRDTYPEQLAYLTPEFIRAIPKAITSAGGETDFVYHADAAAFEIFFLVEAASTHHLFLYRSEGGYPPRREAGAYKLVQRLDGWGKYDVAPRRPAQVAREWRGRLPLETEPFPALFVADAANLRKLWQLYRIAEPLPSIDFETELLLVATVRSGLVKFMQPVIDDEGDLKRNVVATPDYPAFRSYALCLIKRGGIRTMEGEKLP